MMRLFVRGGSGVWVIAAQARSRCAPGSASSASRARAQLDRGLRSLTLPGRLEGILETGQRVDVGGERCRVHSARRDEPDRLAERGQSWLELSPRDNLDAGALSPGAAERPGALGAEGFREAEVANPAPGPYGVEALDPRAVEPDRLDGEVGAGSGSLVQHRFGERLAGRVDGRGRAESRRQGQP